MSNDDATRKIVAVVAKKRNYTNYSLNFNQISTHGANYSSYLYKATISQEQRDDLHLLVKVAALGEEIRKLCPMEEVFYLEIHFYEIISKVFKILEEKNGVPEKYRLFLPKLHAFSKEPLQETLAFDDLSELGFRSFDRFQVLDWKEISRIVEELAKFHALSSAFGQKCPKEYAEAIGYMKTSFKDMMYRIWCDHFKGSRDVLEERHKKVFQRFLEEKMDECFDNMYMKASPRAVFIHADFRPSNMMYKVNDNGDMEVVILDYQTLRSGSVVVDLLNLIFLTTDQKFRRQHYKALLEYYYSQLEQALQRLGVQPDLVYSKEDYQQEVKEMAPLGLALAAFSLPVLLADSSDLPKVDGNFTLDNLSLTYNDLAKRRFTEVIEDFIEWGIIE